MTWSARGVVGHFEEQSLAVRAYLHVRWRLCPFERVLDFVPEEGRLLDVGCGSGLWLTYLALESPDLRLEGIDVDPEKLALAATSTAGDFVLHQGTVEDAAPGAYDCITIVDVLYLMPDGVKERVLAACHEALAPGGVIVVKELDTRPLWKFVPAALEELIAVKLLKLTRGDRLHFQSLGELTRAVERAGFTDLDAVRLDEGYPHPHVLVSAQKPLRLEP